MTDGQAASRYPVRIFDVVVHRVLDLSTHFRRITFAGPSLEAFGVPGPTLDLRIKLLLPVPGHQLSRPGAPDGTLFPGWYQDWLRGEQPGRGWIRSYTVRALRATAQGRELDVDFVVHPSTGGHGAPASDWARAAVPGRDMLIIGPRADAITGATLPAETGIRWDPQGARRVLLAGDETAVPAISSILEALPADVSGEAFLEVPDVADFHELSTGSGVGVTWLARNPLNAPRGELLYDAVRKATSGSLGPLLPGQLRAPRGTAASDRPGDAPRSAKDLYAWVGAEAGTVKSLRRYLVHQLGLDPKRSEFRGYWSLGKAGSGINGVPVLEQQTLP